MMQLQEHMKDINKSLKEIQERNDQKLETLTRETQKSFKEIQENMSQMKKAIASRRRKCKNQLKKYRRTWVNRQKS